MKTQSSEKLIEVKEKITEKIYQESKPCYENLDELEEKAADWEKPAYKLHYMDNDKQLEIIEQELENYSFNKYEKKRLKQSVLLGASPSGNLEAVNKHREEEGLDKISGEE